MSKTKFFDKWASMKKRCRLATRHDAHRYSKRGITYCERWEDFMKFKEDMYESYIVHRKEHGGRNTSLERINNDEGYSPENCKWATQKEQANNRSTAHTISFQEKTQSLTAWAGEIGMSVTGLSDRLNSGWSVERALTQPVRRKK